MTLRRLVVNQHTRPTQFVAQHVCTNCTGFFDSACYQFYLLRLFHSLPFYQVQLHAYLLLPDRIWLLLTPRTTKSVAALMSAVNKAYAEYFSIRFNRHPRQWRRTHSQRVLASSAEVLECQKLIERTPIELGLVGHAGAWRWSSYGLNAFGGDAGFLARHPVVVKFFRRYSDPGQHYRAYINDTLKPRVEAHVV